MVGTDLVFGSVLAGGSRVGAGGAASPGGRFSWGPRPRGPGSRAWEPAGSGLDLVPCRGLSVSLALLGKVWVLGWGREAACGGRACPGRRALRRASASRAAARARASKGSSGGGGGRANFLAGYRAAPRAAGARHAPAPHAHAAPGGPEGAGGVGAAFATRAREHTGHTQNRTESVQLARAARARGRQQHARPHSGRHPRRAPLPGAFCVGARGGRLTHPGAAEGAGGEARGGAADGPGPGGTGAGGAQSGMGPRAPAHHTGAASAREARGPGRQRAPCWGLQGTWVGGGTGSSAWTGPAHHSPAALSPAGPPDQRGVSRPETTAPLPRPALPATGQPSALSSRAPGAWAGQAGGRGQGPWGFPTTGCTGPADLAWAWPEGDHCASVPG